MVLRAFCVGIASLLCLLLCLKAFKVVEVDRQDELPRMATAVAYLDGPKCLSISADHIRIEFREKNGGWGEWQSLEEAVVAQKSINAAHWKRNLKQRVLDATVRSYQLSTHFSQELFMSDTDMLRVQQTLRFVCSPESSEAELAVYFSDAEGIEPRIIRMDPVTLPRNEK